MTSLTFFHRTNVTLKLLFSKFKNLFVSGLEVLNMRYNVLQLPEGGDFEALHCQPSTNLYRSTKLDLTTEPPLLGRCCVCHDWSTFQQI